MYKHGKIFSATKVANRVLGRRRAKNWRQVCYTKLEQNSWLGVAGFWRRLKNLQHKNCAENHPRTHVTRHQLLAQHCCAKNRPCESSRVTSPCSSLRLRKSLSNAISVWSYVEKTPRDQPKWKTLLLSIVPATVRGLSTFENISQNRACIKSSLLVCLPTAGARNFVTFNLQELFYWPWKARYGKGPIRYLLLTFINYKQSFHNSIETFCGPSL